MHVAKGWTISRGDATRAIAKPAIQNADLNDDELVQVLLESTDDAARRAAGFRFRPGSAAHCAHDGFYRNPGKLYPPCAKGAGPRPGGGGALQSSLWQIGAFAFGH